MRLAKMCLLVIGMAFTIYSCAISCGPGPGQSTGPVTYPTGYTLEKQNETGSSK